MGENKEGIGGKKGQFGAKIWEKWEYMSGNNGDMGANKDFEAKRGHLRQKSRKTGVYEGKWGYGDKE